METQVQSLYGNRTRIRVCGVCIERDSILLVNHQHVNNGSFWAPPGGGLEFGEHTAQCLTREFREETGLDIEVGEFLFVCELVKAPLHAIELFFEVRVLGGELMTGTDPESGQLKVIKEVRFVTASELAQWPEQQLHGLFKKARNIGQIPHLRGYFKL